MRAASRRGMGIAADPHIAGSQILQVVAAIDAWPISYFELTDVIRLSICLGIGLVKQGRLTRCAASAPPRLSYPAEVLQVDARASCMNVSISASRTKR